MLFDDQFARILHILLQALSELYVVSLAYNCIMLIVWDDRRKRTRQRRLYMISHVLIFHVSILSLDHAHFGKFKSMHLT